jgi:lipopolysaccharide assembly protein A
MRLVYFFMLLLLAGAVAVFVLQNNDLITLHYLGQSVECSPAILLGIVYLLGMVSGWTIFSWVRHSLQRVVERPAQRPDAYATSKPPDAYATSK